MIKKNCEKRLKTVKKDEKRRKNSESGEKRQKNAGKTAKRQKTVKTAKIILGAASNGENYSGGRL